MRYLFLTGLLLITFISCKDEDDSISFREYDFEIEDFIYKALNTYYYWQDTVPKARAPVQAIRPGTQACPVEPGPKAKPI